MGRLGLVAGGREEGVLVFVWSTPGGRVQLGAALFVWAAMVLVTRGVTNTARCSRIIYRFRFVLVCQLVLSFARLLA